MFVTVPVPVWGGGDPVGWHGRVWWAWVVYTSQIYFGYILRVYALHALYAPLVFLAQVASFLHLGVLLPFLMMTLGTSYFADILRIILQVYTSHGLYTPSVFLTQVASFLHLRFLLPFLMMPSWGPGNFGIDIYYEVQPQTEK